MKQRTERSKDQKRETYMSWPDAAKDILMSEATSDFCVETAKKYGVPLSPIGRNVGDVMLGDIPLGDLPEFIQQDGQVDRRRALQVATRVARHLLRPFNQSVHIGNVDAYIDEWNEELTSLSAGV